MKEIKLPNLNNCYFKIYGDNQPLLEMHGSYSKAYETFRKLARIYNSVELKVIEKH